MGPWLSAAGLLPRLSSWNLAARPLARERKKLAQHGKWPHPHDRGNRVEDRFDVLRASKQQQARPVAMLPTRSGGRATAAPWAEILLEEAPWLCVFSGVTPAPPGTSLVANPLGGCPTFSRTHAKRHRATAVLLLELRHARTPTGAKVEQR